MTRHKPWALILLAVSAVALGACAGETSDGSVVRSPSGIVLGVPNWQPIDAAGSEIVVAGDAGLITAREAQRFPDRYNEWLSLGDGLGFLYYERVNEGAFVQTLSGARAMTVLAQHRFLTERDFVLPVERARTAGEYTYITDDQNGWRCVAFVRIFGLPPRIPGGTPPGNKYFRGLTCASAGSTVAATLESDILDLVGRLTFVKGGAKQANAAPPSVSPDRSIYLADMLESGRRPWEVGRPSRH